MNPPTGTNSIPGSPSAINSQIQEADFNSHSETRYYTATDQLITTNSNETTDILDIVKTDLHQCINDGLKTYQDLMDELFLAISDQQKGQQPLKDSQLKDYHSRNLAVITDALITSFETADTIADTNVLIKIQEQISEAKTKLETLIAQQFNEFYLTKYELDIETVAGKIKEWTKEGLRSYEINMDQFQLVGKSRQEVVQAHEKWVVEATQIFHKLLEANQFKKEEFWEYELTFRLLEYFNELIDEWTQENPDQVANNETETLQLTLRNEAVEGELEPTLSHEVKSPISEEAKYPMSVEAQTPLSEEVKSSLSDEMKSPSEVAENLSLSEEMKPQSEAEANESPLSVVGQTPLSHEAHIPEEPKSPLAVKSSVLSEEVKSPSTVKASDSPLSGEVISTLPVEVNSSLSEQAEILSAVTENSSSSEKVKSLTTVAENPSLSEEVISAAAVEVNSSLSEEVKSPPAVVENSSFSEETKPSLTVAGAAAALESNPGVNNQTVRIIAVHRKPEKPAVTNSKPIATVKNLPSRASRLPVAKCDVHTSRNALSKAAKNTPAPQVIKKAVPLNTTAKRNPLVTAEVRPRASVVPTSNTKVLSRTVSNNSRRSVAPETATKTSTQTATSVKTRESISVSTSLKRAPTRTNSTTTTIQAVVRTTSKSSSVTTTQSKSNVSKPPAESNEAGTKATMNAPRVSSIIKRVPSKPTQAAAKSTAEVKTSAVPPVKSSNTTSSNSNKPRTSLWSRAAAIKPNTSNEPTKKSTPAITADIRIKADGPRATSRSQESKPSPIRKALHSIAKRATDVTAEIREKARSSTAKNDGSNTRRVRYTSTSSCAVHGKNDTPAQIKKSGRTSTNKASGVTVDVRSRSRPSTAVNVKASKAEAYKTLGNTAVLVAAVGINATEPKVPLASTSNTEMPTSETKISSTVSDASIMESKESMTAIEASSNNEEAFEAVEISGTCTTERESEAEVLISGNGSSESGAAVEMVGDVVTTLEDKTSSSIAQNTTALKEASGLDSQAPETVSDLSSKGPEEVSSVDIVETIQ